MTDSAPTVDIPGSPAKLMMLLALGIAMIAACAWVAWGGIVPAGSWSEFMGWVGVAFFSLCLAIIVWLTPAMFWCR